jgi:anti-sigma B factor antagonist
MDIDISTGVDGISTVVTPRGELDVLTAAQLRTAIGEVIDDGHAHLVLDAAGITFLDSTGIGVLVIALRRTRASDGSFALAGAHGRTLRTLSLTGLDRVFDLYDSVADAQAALARLVGAP